MFAWRRAAHTAVSSPRFIILLTFFFAPTNRPHFDFFSNTKPPWPTQITIIWELSPFPSRALAPLTNSRTPTALQRYVLLKKVEYKKKVGLKKKGKDKGKTHPELHTISSSPPNRPSTLCIFTGIFLLGRQARHQSRLSALRLRLALRQRRRNWPRLQGD